MPQVIAYRKYITREVTRELLLPEGADHQRLGTELATVDGVTYVSLPDSAVLPSGQPAEVAESVAVVTLTDALRQQIADASPHVALIRHRVAEMIAAEYSYGDEIKLLRTAPSAEFSAYNAYAEECRAWGRTEKARLGL